ncbi:MAG: S24 family peptidase, partial [Pseudomonadota bacterium]|nr:S24 family peptidase [Pseudomonadota bacterium]
NARSYAVDVADEAMEGEIRAGDRVIVDGEIQPIPGDLVIVRSHRTKRTYLRKYRALGFSPDSGELIFEAKPINQDYLSMNSESDLLQVLGVVVEHRRIRRKT